ncbi:DUF5946 family protein [Occultella gossypii]|uniref:Uncharacterized protein n=1 Tax=Occultella gossypii TaxID=2800820 RepID=A0ABS7SA86_9MICO|nr:DUF5946 family protein [Occultella gossypii]MBZ2196211.1 hypothetical protein [Occultella gossypii]
MSEHLDEGTAPCSECGAVLPAGGDCWDRVHELLEIEARLLPGIDDVETGMRAHYFAIATYQLQHPSRLTTAAVAQLRDGVRRMLASDPPPIDHLRRQVRGFAEGPRRVTRRASAGDRAHVPHWPTRWTMTATDVIGRPDAEYADTVGDWARRTLDDLDGLGP